MAAPAAAKSAYGDSRSPGLSLRRQASRPAGHPGAALAASSLATRPPILGRTFRQRPLDRGEAPAYAHGTAESETLRCAVERMRRAPRRRGDTPESEVWRDGRDTVRIPIRHGDSGANGAPRGVTRADEAPQPGLHPDALSGECRPLVQHAAGHQLPAAPPDHRLRPRRGASGTV